MDTTNHRRELLRCKFFIVLAAVLLAVTMSPLTVLADEIEEQLAAGDYVEGEVIAAIMIDAGQMEAQADDPYEVTELISVDPSAVQEASQDDQTQASAKHPSY